MRLSAESVNRWQQFSIEMIAILIFIYNIYLYQQERPNLIAYFLTIFIGIALFLIIKSMLRERFLAVHSIILIPILFSVTMFFNFDIFVALLISVFVPWRLAKHEIEPDMENENIVIGLTFALVLLAYVVGFFSEAPQRNDVFFLYMVQFLILFIGKWISYYLFVKEKDQPIKRIVTSGVILVTLFSTVTGLYFLFPYIQRLFSTVFGWISYAISYSLGWLFMLIENLTDDIEPAEGHIEEVILDGGNSEEIDYENIEPIITEDHLKILFFSMIIIALIILILFYRKRYAIKGEQHATENEQIGLITTNHVKNKKWNYRRKKTKLPKDEVRKAFYKFESWAQKNHYGRRPSESIEEWLSRYKLSHFVNKDVINLYRHVRYGDIIIDEQDKEQYLVQIEELKSEFEKIRHNIKE